MRFIPHSPADIAQMLAAIGVGSVDELFRDIPAELRASGAIDLPPGLPEQAVRARLAALAARNRGAQLLSLPRRRRLPALHPGGRSTTSCSAPSSTPPTRRTSPR